MKTKMVILVATALLLGSSAARAGSIKIDFNTTGSGGTWSWAGGIGSTLTSTALEVNVKQVGAFMNYDINGTETFTFTTGGFTGGSGTALNPFVFGPSAANSFTIVGCVPPQTDPCPSVTLFTGQFADTQVAINGAGNLNIIGDTVTGTLDPGLASFFGIPTNFEGSLSYTESGNGPGSGLTGSGDLIGGSPVPEPAALGLVGLGLLGIGVLTRKAAH